MITMLPVMRKRTQWPDFTNDFVIDNFFPEIKKHNYFTQIPAVNIMEDDDQFRIELAAPGLEKKDLHLHLKEDLLTISSEKKEEKAEETEDNFKRKEFSYTSFCRSFSLPDLVDKEKIKAFHKNGVLTIHIPKNAESKINLSREIKIA